MHKALQTYQKGGLGIKCMTILMILINVLYLIISFLVISGGTTLKMIFGEYYYVLWYASSVNTLSSLCIAAGFLLFALSIFGIVAAIKGSTAMTNFYGLFLFLIVIIQLAAAITGFTLISQTDGLVRYSLQSMMYISGYSDDSMDPAMRWIQQTFQCCGNDGPSDWGIHGNVKFARTTMPPEAWTGDYYIDYDHFDGNSTDVFTTTTIKMPDYYKMPPSCCIPYSSYDGVALRCEHYFTGGCHGQLNEILSQSVMSWSSSALSIAIIQIVGIGCAFTFARVIRREKTNRDVHKWAMNESLGFNRKTYVDQIRNSEPNVNEVKHI